MTMVFRAWPGAILGGCHRGNGGPKSQRRPESRALGREWCPRRRDNGVVSVVPGQMNGHRQAVIAGARAPSSAQVGRVTLPRALPAGGAGLP